jgi:hypothetical protein
MPLHATTRGVLTSLAALGAVWMLLQSPMLARLLPFLTGQCGPELGPASRWNDWWGIGWLRFHNQLVDEVVQADKGQVSKCGICALPCANARHGSLICLEETSLSAAAVRSVCMLPHEDVS